VNLELISSVEKISSSIKITGSKSESNRLLLLQALYSNIKVLNISNSDDSKAMQHALNTNDDLIDVHHAGTTMRFLTSYFAVQNNREVVLTGSQRMKERPIKILVDALRQLGATIIYEEKEGYPPLKIKGGAIHKNKVSLKANVSSQYISSLLLIAPKLENGLLLELEGEITSKPYLQMTLSLLSKLGIKNTFKKNSIRVFPTENIPDKEIVVESDWSSASYFYGLAALSKTATINLSSYRENSLQGDSVLAKIYEHFGVETVFDSNTISIFKKEVTHQKKHLELNLIHAPDIAQTIVVSCFGNGYGCHLMGLHTLKIKETDRLEALKKELIKLGANIEITNNSLMLHPSERINNNDHRMAMAFAPLALKVPLKIENAEVVSKSYPDFWLDLQKIGIKNHSY